MAQYSSTIAKVRFEALLRTDSSTNVGVHVAISVVRSDCMIYYTIYRG